MKIKSLIFTVLLAGISFLLAACGQKKDPSEEAFDALAERVPASANIFAGGYISLEEQLEVYERGDWQKVVAAINGNSAIAEQIEKSLNASTDVKYFFERWLCGADPREMLEKACAVAPEPLAFVAYSEQAADADGKEKVSFVIAATMAKAYADSLEHFLLCCKKENEVRGHGAGTWTQKNQGEKTLYTYSESEFSVVFAFCGNDVVVASSEKTLADFEASASNPPANPLRDSAAFKKAADGVEEYNFVCFVNLDGFKDFRVAKRDDNSFEKAFRETAESVSAFANFSMSGNTADALVRMEFSKPIFVHDIVSTMAKNKPATLANALPGSDYAIGIGAPALSDAQAKEMEISEKDLDEIRRFDAKNLYLSVGNAKKIAAFVSGDRMNLPDVFVKLDCGNSAVLLEDKKMASFFDGNNPMAQKQTINGTEVFSSIFFGIKYAMLGKTSLYVSNLFDAPAALALAQGSGKSAEAAGTFSALVQKLDGENALEAFVNDRTALEIQAAVAEAEMANPQRTSTEIEAYGNAVKFQNLLLALTKKSLSGIALRRNATALELYWTCECEYDFDAFAEALKNLK